MTARTWTVVQHGSYAIVGKLTAELEFKDHHPLPGCEPVQMAHVSSPDGPITFTLKHDRLFVRSQHAPRVHKLEGFEP